MYNQHYEQKSEQVKNHIRRIKGSFLKEHFSWRFLKSVLNPKEILLPITIQKPVLWCIYLVLLASLITALSMTNLWWWLYHAINANIIPLAIFLVAVEPLYFAAMMLFTKYPKVKVTYKSEEQQEQISTIDASVYSILSPRPIHSLTTSEQSLSDQYRTARQRTAIIIACHQSGEHICKTLKHWMSIVPPENIYIVDNGNHPYPKNKQGTIIDQTKSIIENFNRQHNCRINYLFSNIGNKTYALYLGAKAAKTREQIENVFICDDDIIPAQEVITAVDLLDTQHQAVVFPIKAINKNNHGQAITAWQNLEYALSDHALNFYDRTCGPSKPHGACSLWDIDTMLSVLEEKHDTRFMAEDLKMGHILLQQGGRLRFAHGLYVKTFVPSSFIGPMPNYYTQRVRVWEMARFFYTPLMIYYFFTTWVKSNNILKTIRDNIFLKIEQLHFLYQVVADTIRLPVFILSIINWYYWAITGVVYGILVGVILAWNYLKLYNKPDEQHGLFTILTYPVYKVIYKIYSILALARALFIFIPNYSQLIRIDQLELKKESLYILEQVITLVRERYPRYSCIPTQEIIEQNKLDQYILELLKEKLLTKEQIITVISNIVSTHIEQRTTMFAGHEAMVIHHPVLRTSSAPIAAPLYQPSYSILPSMPPPATHHPVNPCHINLGMPPRPYQGAQMPIASCYPRPVFSHLYASVQAPPTEVFTDIFADRARHIPELPVLI